jgi:dephospho-CoA kinase
MIIGITGTLGAGKGTLVEILLKKGFKHFSVRDFLVKEIEKRNMPVNRDSMVIVANDLRKTYSPSYIILELYKKAKDSGGNSVIESIRAVGEVEALKKLQDFYLISIDANSKVRYERIKKRGSVTDNISYKEFLENENREMNSTDPNKQNISACMNMADFQIFNNGSIEELNLKVEEVLNYIFEKKS